MSKRRFGKHALASRAVDVAIRRGQFIIRPLKKMQKARKQAARNLAYNAWAMQNEQQCFVDDAHRQGPLISIVVPAYNPLPDDFLAMVYSVVNQHYESWELVIVDTSTEAAIKQKIKAVADIDTRITVLRHKNLGISGNTNIGIETARGEYIAFVDHDDLLHPCALHASMEVIARESAELVYSDEDKIKADSSLFFEPFCKPSWSPSLLQNVNYINHLTIVKAAYVKKVHGLRPAFDGAQDYDFLLRVTDVCKPKIVHVPRTLYHWRAAPTSTAASIGTKPYVLQAGTKALQEHLGRTKTKGKAKALVNRPGFYEIDFTLPTHLTIVLPPVDLPNRRLCAVWLQKLLEMCEFSKVQVVAGEWLKNIGISYDKAALSLIPEKNYWQEAAKAIQYDAAVCFTVAALPTEHHALDKLVGRAFQQHAIVAPVIIGDDGTIVDAGLVDGPQGRQQLFSGNTIGESTYLGTTEWVRNVDGLSMGVFAAHKTIMHDLLKTIPANQAPNDVHLSAFLHRQPDTEVVMDAYAVHTFKGYLANPPITNRTHYNPQLGSQPPIMMRMSAWGEIGGISERDNN